MTRGQMFLLQKLTQIESIRSFSSEEMSKMGKKNNILPNLSRHSVYVCVLFQLSKSNSQYHKIFKEISKEEQLRQSKSMITTIHSTLNA